MKKNQNQNQNQSRSVRALVEENFYSIIVFLVLFFILFLIGSLFYPIQTQSVPNTPEDIAIFNTAINRRTIIVRSIASIISGISVIIAFISIMESRETDEANDRLKVLPFPAYHLPRAIEYDGARSQIELTRNCSPKEIIIENIFEITIKNIGLGSLVDYEVTKAHIKNEENKKLFMGVSFLPNVIIGKGEKIRVKISLKSSLRDDEHFNPEDFESVYIYCFFRDLLGSEYVQEFIIKSEVHHISDKSTKPTEDNSRRYSINPIQITHTHPILQ